MNAKQLLELRARAGRRYAEAAATYLDAWAALQAYDQACANANTAPVGIAPGFGALPTISPHPEFLSDVAPLLGSVPDRARALMEQILTEASVA